MDHPPEHASEDVSRILSVLTAGEASVSSELLPLVYADLRKLASSRIARLAPGQTLQATELVHEAYLRLVGSNDPGWQGRAHFFSAAARAMRNILADHLIRKDSLKRGGNLHRVGEDTAAQFSSEGPTDDVLALEEALQKFGREYPRRAEVVTLSFFGGLSTTEIAEVMQVSPRTVEREWRFAKAWLNRSLGSQSGGS